MTAVLARPAPVQPRQAPVTSRRVLIAWWAAAISIVSLFGVAFTVALSGSQEHAAQKRLYGTLRAQLADGTAPLGPVVVPGKPVALLRVPALGLQAVVIEGTSGADLRSGPGHRRDTVLPGQVGTSVVYGRAVSYGGPFGELSSLQRGDTISTVTGQGTATYTVARVRRPGDPLPAPLAAGTGRLVLASLEGSGWRRGWAPQQPVYVDAVLVGKAFPAPGVPSGQLPPAEQLGATDSSGLIMVVLWLQALVVALLLTAWASARWGLWQAWLVGMPVVLAALWATCNAGLPLLPNAL